jgi:hypothetical protein
MSKKFQTGHDFAAQAAIKGAEVKTWDPETRNFYVVKTEDGTSTTFPVGNLSRGTRHMLLFVFRKLGLFVFLFIAWVGFRVVTELLGLGEQIGQTLGVQ